MASTWHACVFILTMISLQQIMQTGAIGVCYGMNGNNLPSPSDVVALYKKHNFQKMRLFEPNAGVQGALEYKSIYVSLGVRNEDMPNLATNQEAANTWVKTNVAPYKNTNYQYVTVGNEAIPGQFAQHIAPAMKNLRAALDSIGYSQVKVTTVVATRVVGTSYPPSQATFSSETLQDMRAIISLLNGWGSKKNPPVLMVNVYPYFAYASDPNHISLDYAQFFSTYPVVKDGQYEYYNLFDAMVDAVYAAMEKVGGGNVWIAVSETGWPSAGNGNFTTPNLAQRYNLNFKTHIETSKTPRRPQNAIDGFLFAMFNENLKPAGVEQNFGLFYPNGQPIYPFIA